MIIMIVIMFIIIMIMFIMIMIMFIISSFVLRILGDCYSYPDILGVLILYIDGLE